jgi:hypothetical protein
LAEIAQYCVALIVANDKRSKAKCAVLVVKA